MNDFMFRMSTRLEVLEQCRGQSEYEDIMVIINTIKNFSNDEYKVIPVSQNYGENILVTLR